MSHQVTVEGSQLNQALRTLTKVATAAKLGRGTETILWTNNGELTIELPATSITVPAEGTFPGRLRISWAYFRGLGQSASAKAQRVLLEYDGEFLKVGGMGASAFLETTATSRIDLPVNATFADIVAAVLMHSDEEVRVSGLTQTAAQAMKRRDRLVARAADTLGPLGVSAMSLSNFVDAQLRAKARR